MGLYEVLKGIDLPPTHPDYDKKSERRVPYKPFAAALRLMEESLLTKAQVVTAFELDASEQTDLNTLIAAAVTAERVGNVGALIEADMLTKPQAKALLGL